MPRLSAPRARRLRAGFSLVELLVVTVLLAIVGTAIIRVLGKQQQSYRDLASNATMRRELRMSGMLMTQDLRSISSAGSDVQEMAENRIGFNGTYGSSVICAKSGSDEFVVPPPGLARHDLTSWTTTPVVGDTIFVYNDSLSAGADDDVWQKLIIDDFSTTTSSCTGAPYTDPVLDPPASKPRYKVEVRFPAGSTKIGDSVKVGAAVRLTRPMRYELFQASGSRRWYLGYSEYKNGSWGSAEAVSGPLRSYVAGDNGTTGLQFRYFDTTGTRLTSIAQKLRLARIDIYARAQGGTAAVTERRGALLVDSALFRVGLRNNK